MKYETKFQTLKLADIVEPPYNPREPIVRGSDEYKALRRSLEQHGMVEPPVVNLHNMRCIGGNQRLAVLRDMGVVEIECSVINQPDESKEKKLCLGLNRIEGRWNTDNLGNLLRDDDVLQYETGFDEDEVRLYRQLEDTEDPDDDGGPYEDEDPDGMGEDEDGADEEDAGDDEPDNTEPPTMGTTVVRVGHLHFKVEVSKYKRLVESIRDTGVFDNQEIAKEMKRRLLSRD